jgi:hypothetical protein
MSYLSYLCPTQAIRPPLPEPTGAAPAEPPKQPNDKPQNDIRSYNTSPTPCIRYAYLFNTALFDRQT